ncbi:DNA-3-methyladenine glycosylase [Liquorilactobacillus vini]|uniref:DNA-3-methyladenine glycosylase n=1 Tax=Liquorilactobacillus vini TaxID=238015 RepID=UPI000551AA9F|nr:DNA-3-methyladenine glycosylase [Liquorilactobacillus vini]
MSNLELFFSQQPTEIIAQQLLGKKMIYQSQKGEMAALIVETEAYLGQKDSTAHAYRGHRTPANEALYGPPGMIYIFSLRGRMMLNFITQQREVPQGILIRGIEPIVGKEIMKKNRLKHGFELTNGPGKLTEALGIVDRTLNLTLLNQGSLKLDLDKDYRPQKIISAPRIGVSRRGSWTDKPLRFFVAGNPYVSQLPKQQMDLINHGWQNF